MADGHGGLDDDSTNSITLKIEDFSVGDPASLPHNPPSPVDHSHTEVLPLRVSEYPGGMQHGPPGELVQVLRPPSAHAMPRIHPEVKDEKVIYAEDYFNEQENEPHISNIHHHTSGHTSTVSNSPSVPSPNLSISSQQPPVSSSVPVGCVIPRVVDSVSSESSGLSSSRSKQTGNVAINSRVEVKASQVINTGSHPHAAPNQLITNRETLNAVNRECGMKFDGSLVKDSFNQTGHVQGTSEARSESASSYIPAGLIRSLRSTLSEEKLLSPRDGSMPADGDPAVGIAPHRELQTRNYQVEIAERSLNGHNDIIILPTGTGKTYVAIYIILEHLKRRGHHNSKVLFMVPTGVLAQQQHDKICEFLPSDKKQSCVKITGEDGDFGPDMLRERFEDSSQEVFVLTPQMVENYLQGFQDASLREFSLIIFDECHHAQKKHVYNKLLMNYMDKKTEGITELPQLIGLTASIGVGDSKSQKDVVDFIIALAARMHLTEPPSSVTLHVEELKACTSQPEHIPKVMKFYRSDDCSKLIQTQVMAKIEQKVEQKLKMNGFQELLEEWKKSPKDRESQIYNQGCTDFLKTLKAYLDHKDRQKDTHYCIVALEHLKIYARALEIIALARCSDGLKYIKSKLDTPENQAVDDLRKLYIETVQNLESLAPQLDKIKPNEKLKVLEGFLNEIKSEKGEQSRVLIFAQQRRVCRSVASWLESLQGHWKPRAFTSQGKSALDAGMVPSERKAVRSGFEEGTYNVLVSTSIAEEGIDIQECNAVIKYMYMKNMISNIQIAGRTRAMQGVVYSIIDGKMHQMEQSNKLKERWMNEALRRIRSMDLTDFLDKITEEQENVRAELENVQLMAKYSKKPQQKKLDDGEISCGGCGTSLSSVNKIRCYLNNHHYVFDRDFLDSKVDPYPEETPGKVDGEKPYGKLLCKTCKKKIGNVVIIREMKLAVFSVDQIKITACDTFRQWSDLKDRFHVQTLKKAQLLKEGPNYHIDMDAPVNVRA